MHLHHRLNAKKLTLNKEEEIRETKKQRFSAEDNQRSVDGNNSQETHSYGQTVFQELCFCGGIFFLQRV